MYAIISTGGKQYKVAEGDVIDVERLDAQPGDEVNLDVVLLSDGKQVVCDAASLDGAKVTGTIVDQHRGDKQLVFKFQKRKRYRRTKGHRQCQTRLEVSHVPALAGAAATSATSETSE